MSSAIVETISAFACGLPGCLDQPGKKVKSGQRGRTVAPGIQFVEFYEG